jgi:hypothetical protein
MLDYKYATLSAPKMDIVNDFIQITDYNLNTMTLESAQDALFAMVKVQTGTRRAEHGEIKIKVNFKNANLCAVRVLITNIMLLPPENEYLFPKFVNGEPSAIPMTPADESQRWKDICYNARLLIRVTKIKADGTETVHYVPKYTTHSTRHTFAY